MEERDFFLRAFYKRIFRMPTFNDLYYTDIGNVSLNPEFVEPISVWRLRLESGILTSRRVSSTVMIM